MLKQSYDYREFNRLSNIATEFARRGIKAGFTDKSIILKHTAWHVHCMRGNIHLLDAHMIALEATREALREVTR